MLLNVFFITGSYHGEMTKNMNPASNPPIIEAYKKEFGLQEPSSTIQKRFIVKGRVKKN